VWGSKGLKGGGGFNHESHESSRKGKVRVVVAGFHSFSCTFVNFVVETSVNEGCEPKAS